LTPLPTYIDPEAWNDYESMRRRIKKPMTPRIIRQKLALLQKIKDAGHDCNAWIDAATNGHWLDFYQPKELELTRKTSTDSSSYLEQQSEHLAQSRAAGVPPEIKRLADKLRRVA
jgi:hypothetical protein